eukprot:1016183-Amphidinium_carterae.1
MLRGSPRHAPLAPPPFTFKCTLQHRFTTLHRTPVHISDHVTHPPLLLWRRATVPSPDPLCMLPSGRHRLGRTPHHISATTYNRLPTTYATHFLMRCRSLPEDVGTKMLFATLRLRVSWTCNDEDFAETLDIVYSTHRHMEETD